MFSLLSLFQRRTVDAGHPGKEEHCADHPREADWTRLRAAPRDTDLFLSGPTRAWLRSLPSRLRPNHLCSNYPRIANQLAVCWGEPELAERLFDNLMTDQRGNREGFPPLVATELQHLREFHASRLAPGPGSGPTRPVPLDY
jgi:hypothetical protein